MVDSFRIYIEDKITDFNFNLQTLGHSYPYYTITNKHTEDDHNAIHTHMGFGVAPNSSKLVDTCSTSKIVWKVINTPKLGELKLKVC